jgi:ARG/rhodanese/phosphatase superfamily protein
MTVTLANVFEALIKSEVGYSFGKPKRVDEKSLTCVLPILRQSEEKRTYITFPETDKVLVFDTGSIQEMEADNQTDSHVFMRSGTLFRGSTQERALQRSAILFPHKKARMAVRCVHASRGIRSGTNVKYGGVSPLSFDQKNYNAGYAPKSQAEYWANVQSTTADFCKMSGETMHEPDMASLEEPMARHATSQQVKSRIARKGYSGPHYGGVNAGGSISAPPTKMDDLASAMDSFSSRFDEVLSKIKIDDHQAGLALITDTGVQTVECFDHQDSWRALHESAVKRMGAELVKEDPESVFEFKPEHAHKAVTKVLALPFERNEIWHHRKENGDGDVVISGLSYRNEYVGEAVELNGQLIHLVILKVQS